jgi:transcriptional antiterminator NusG
MEQKEVENMNWYVLRVMGGKERKTVAFIEKEIDRLGMNDFVSQILVPTEKVYQIRNGKKVSKERNFFPGYVLVEANLVGEVPHILKNITNVLGRLGATKGGVPVPMRKSEINRILGKVDEMALTDENINIPLIAGETVKGILIFSSVNAIASTFPNIRLISLFLIGTGTPPFVAPKRPKTLVMFFNI